METILSCCHGRNKAVMDWKKVVIDGKTVVRGREKVVVNGKKIVEGRKKVVTDWRKVVTDGRKVVTGRKKVVKGWKKVVTGWKKVAMIPLAHRGTFCSSFLLFYSSFFVYFFASLHQRNICKFTLCCVFQLVHQSLRNIVIIIFFISFQSNHRTLLYRHCHCHCWSPNIDFKCVRITSWSLQL